MGHRIFKLGSVAFRVDFHLMDWNISVGYSYDSECIHIALGPFSAFFYWGLDIEEE